MYSNSTHFSFPFCLSYNYRMRPAQYLFTTYVSIWHEEIADQKKGQKLFEAKIDSSNENCML